MHGKKNRKMQKTCLVVIDGLGIDSNEQGNAVKAAKTPCMTKLSNEFPYMTLNASGLDFGLPDGLMGNSNRPCSGHCLEKTWNSLSKINVDPLSGL